MKCCDNCKYLVKTEKNNRYHDVEYFCLATGYYVAQINVDVTKYRHLAPGGRELICKYERK